jgi:hypothetical protein
MRTKKCYNSVYLFLGKLYRKKILFSTGMKAKKKKLFFSTVDCEEWKNVKNMN